MVSSTVIVARMSHWKWRETKLQPSRARSGQQISCCLVSLHFLGDILATITVGTSLVGLGSCRSVQQKQQEPSHIGFEGISAGRPR